MEAYLCLSETHKAILMVLRLIRLLIFDEYIDDESLIFHPFKKAEGLVFHPFEKAEGLDNMFALSALLQRISITFSICQLSLMLL